MSRIFSLLVITAAVVWFARKQGWIQGLSLPNLGKAGGFGGPSGFRLEFKAGRITRVEGVLPRAAYNGIEEVLSGQSVSGEIRGGPGPEMVVDGDVPEGLEQRLRNVYLASRLR
ncbi:MAG: DUF3634 family protein [Acidobacteriota bacterium]